MYVPCLEFVQASILW